MPVFRGGWVWLRGTSYRPFGPAKSDGADGDEPGNALVVGQMGVFEIEAAGFQGGVREAGLAQQGLDSLTRGVGLQGLFWLAVGDDDHQLASLGSACRRFQPRITNRLNL